MRESRRRTSARLASLLGLVLAFSVACGAPSGPGAVGPTPAATPVAPSTPTPAPSAVPEVSAPAPTPDPKQQAFGLHSPLPLAGEFAVTGNADDRTLSVVPIGAAAVATTVQLDLAPRAIGAVPNSDTVLAADDSPTSQQLAIASLNSSSQSGTIDAGSPREIVAGPPPSGSTAPLLVVSEADNTIRSVDPSSRELGSPLPIGPGPHAVYVAPGNSMLTPQVYVANAGDGTVTVLDQKLTTVQDTLSVGGKPVGVTRTVDGRLWVADVDAGAVSMFDTSGGGKLQTIQVGPHLTALAATPDGHFLALASDSTLYAVDLVSTTVSGSSSSSAVRQLAVPGGVLALATGAEITRAYATTGDGNLIYWDLAANTISQTIPVGRNPVALTLGLVEPSGGVSVPSGAGTTSGGGGGTSSTAGTGTTSSTTTGGTGTGSTTTSGTGTGSTTTGTGTGSTTTGGTGTGSTTTGTGTGSTTTGGAGTGSTTTGTGSGTSSSTTGTGTGSTSTSGTGSGSTTTGTGTGTGSSTTGTGTGSTTTSGTWSGPTAPIAPAPTVASGTSSTLGTSSASSSTPSTGIGSASGGATSPTPGTGTSSTSSSPPTVAP